MCVTVAVQCCHISRFFFLMIRRPPRSTLFPYTTLFRSLWSASYQPSGVEPDSYEVTFTEDRAEFVRRDGTITTILDVVVSPEYNAEVRRVSVANAGTRARDIELTSYAELVLAPPAADTAHPAFSKLFVQTEYLARIGAILATRRRRSPTEPEIWAAHLAVVEGQAVGRPG